MEIDNIVIRASIGEYRMQRTGHIRSTVRTAALVTLATTLTAGGVAAAALVTPVRLGPAPTAGSSPAPSLVVALPRSVATSNRAW